MTELRFDGKVVIITGAGAGLGRAYAHLFSSRGASVVVNDLGGGRHGDGSSTKAADTVVMEIRGMGGSAVANYDSVLDGEKIVKTAIDEFGRIDVVVNNAGILRDKSFARMTIDDWDLIHNVHVKGAMITTQAAWPYLRKQKYGRIIFTSSNSGLYGNFGQANYSAAKMALVGLASTLAIEGQSSGINTNIIVPTAGSRLTQDVLPPEFFNELKPELIAPTVLWLCHENCRENGSIIESALGWAGKCHLIRSNGAVMRKSIAESLTPEAVRDNWSKVTDMSNAKHYTSIAEATGELMNVVEILSNTSNEMIYSMKHTYDFRDIILYALSVGASLKESEMSYVYENHDNFKVIPTYFVSFVPMGCMGSDMLDKALPNRQINLAAVVHGEQYLKIFDKMPTDATVDTKFRVQAVLDKGKHAFLLIEHETFNSVNGNKIAAGQMTAVLQNAGGFGGARNSEYEIPTISPPKRQPDATYSQQTSPDQAALYRLTGDINPLHIDPNMALMGGFQQPILHGLCSLGFATRHVLKTYGNDDPGLFDAVKVRFAKPVIPGQTLRTDMWRDNKRIHFQTVVVENNVPVITGAYMDLKEVIPKATKSKL